MEIISPVLCMCLLVYVCVHVCVYRNLKGKVVMINSADNYVIT